MTKTKRRIYRVKPPLRRARHGWRIITPAGETTTCVLKTQAVLLGRVWAARLWYDEGQLSQLVIHGRDGRIQTEHTYGKDPRRTKG